MIPEPKFRYGETVVLTRPLTLLSRGPWETRTYVKGETVVVKRAVPIYDNFGYFARYHYHVCVSDSLGDWFKIVTDEHIEHQSVLDVLAKL